MLFLCKKYFNFFNQKHIEKKKLSTMPTLRERKNPSSGTKVRLSFCSGLYTLTSHALTLVKVNPGKDAPVQREAAGLVASESLAAESVQQGGEFAQNRNAQPEVVSGSELRNQSGREGVGHSGKEEAPRYAAEEHTITEEDTNKKPPHGRRAVKEDASEEAGVKKKKNDGLERALRSEPGSEDDPSRLAERQMLQGQSLRDRGPGPRQSGLEGETKFDALDPEVSS